MNKRLHRRATHTSSVMNYRSLGTLAIGVWAAIALAACGGGNSGGTAGNGSSGSNTSSSASSSSSSSSSSSNSGSSSSSSATAYSGQFIDAPAKGLTYTASPSGLTGTTDANGTFMFDAGDNVAFTLSVGSSNSLNFGSITPPAPATGSATVFVLSLPNGLQVAQVLQSLNHGTASAMDVSGLTLPAADVTNLNDYIASGGTELPANTTDVQMLGQAQTDSGISPSQFIYVGGSTITQVMLGLQQTLLGLPAVGPMNLDSAVSGRVAFHQGFFTNSGATSEDFGIDYFNANGTISAVTSNASDALNQGTSTYSASGNVLTFSDSGAATDVITLSYIDSVEGLWSDEATGSTGAGSYVFLQSLTPSGIAGKTLTITGALGIGCGAVPLQITIDSSGSSFAANCQGSSQSQGTGTVGTMASIPGVITLKDTGGGTYLVGLLAGSTLASGAIAVVEEPNTVPSGDTAIDGIFGLKAQ